MMMDSIHAHKNEEMADYRSDGSAHRCITVAAIDNDA